MELFAPAAGQQTAVGPAGGRTVRQQQRLPRAAPDYCRLPGCLPDIAGEVAAGPPRAAELRPAEAGAVSQTIAEARSHSGQCVFYLLAISSTSGGQPLSSSSEAMQLDFSCLS